MELARERAKAARVEAERASERAENASLRQQMGPISLPTRSAQTLHTHLRRVGRLLHIMQVANGSRDVRHDDKRAGQASLCAVQANTKANRKLCRRRSPELFPDNRHLARLTTIEEFIGLLCLFDWKPMRHHHFWMEVPAHEVF